MKRGIASLLAAASLGMLSGCDRGVSTAIESPAARTEPAGLIPKVDRDGNRPAAQAVAPAIVFKAEDLPFVYERGDSGLAFPVEPTGSGVGLFDFDGDGDLDVFFAQGVPLPPGSKPNPPADVLLRNDGARRFTDISREVGLTSKGYGHGVTIADYDGDGDEDIYVTRYGPNTLWRNDGGKFVDVAEKAGVACPLWSLGAAFFDYDGDGDLDLFVANYFAFDPKDAPFDRDPETNKPDYGMPSRFPGEPDVLYRNNGDGTFTDATRQAGVAGEGRGMGVLASDLDRDGKIDILVANDAMPNAVWRNKGDGTFEDVAVAWGLAYNGEGQTEANMGIAHGDTDEDSFDDILITHFFNEHDTLWRGFSLGDGRVSYRDATYDAGIGNDSKVLTGWGAVFADFDQDGHEDILIANGHIRKERSQVYRYDNPPILWRNRGDGRFDNATKTGGAYFRTLHQGRGLAAGDLDGDGDLDAVIVQYHAPSVVLWNETENQGHWLSLKLVGSGKNRDAIGSRVSATVGGVELVRWIDGGGSYLSTSDRRVHWGLGKATQVDRLEVRRPSGRIERQENLAADRVWEWTEGKPAVEKPSKGPASP